MFKIIAKDKYSKARLGVLNTPHGKVKTPAYAIVATHAQVKCLRPSDIKKTKTQIVIANAYHLRDRLSITDTSSRLYTTPLLNKLGIKIPTMTDSGGFQVFSLGFGKKNRVGKILNPMNKRGHKSFADRQNIRISSRGVYFKIGGKTRFLSPASSIRLQQKLGSDIIFSFDECTSPFDGFDYNKKAMERTHKWALECLKSHNFSRSKASGDRGLVSGKQMLFGIVQGGRFKSLRTKSAKFIGSLPFDGFGIGGSFGKNEMVQTLKWVVPYLPEEKPRHLLGVGRIEDIFNAVEQGVDLFDCVIPTREARHGRIYTKQGYFDISKFRKTKIPLEKACKCLTCKAGITRAKLYDLLKSTKISESAQGKRWTTLHNIWFFNNLLEKIRESIKNNKFRLFKNKFLKQLK